MEIQGKIIAVLEPRGGTSRNGNAWKMQEYVIETHDQYPRQCCFNVFGEDRINQFNIQMNEELTVSFDINAREYNGRWYNDIRAWKVERTAAANPAAAPAPAAPTAAPEPQAAFNDPLGGGNSDLPF